MSSHHIITWLIIGLIAGALAGRVVRGRGFGILGDIVVGIVGALVGGFLLHLATGESGAAAGFIAECFVAFIGAVLLLWLLRLMGIGRGRRRRGFRGAYPR